MEFAAIEHAARAAWQYVLNEEVGSDDNFFRLGGNSLAALRMLTRMKADLAMRIGVGTLFQHPRFEDFVRAVAANQAPESTDSADRRQSRLRPSVLQLERLRYYEETATPSEGMTMTTRMRGPLVPERLRDALRVVVGRHDGLRLLFTTRIPARQLTGAAKDLASVEVSLADSDRALRFETVSLSGSDAEPAAINARLTAHAAQPHDLAHGPRLRALLLRLDADDWIFTLTVDHIVYDPESHLVVLREVAAVYDAASAGVAPQLPAAPSYAEWVSEDWASREQPEGQRRLRFWSETYAADGLFPPADLPALGGENGGRGGRARSVRRELPGDWLAKVLAISAENHTTVFNVLLAAFVVARSRLIGDRRLGTIVSFADRADHATTDVVGLVASAMPIWVDIDPGEPFAKVVQRVTAATVTTMDHSVPMFAAAGVFVEGKFGTPPPSRVREVSRGWGAATFEMHIDGPEPDPVLRLDSIDSTPYDPGPQPFHMPLGGVMLYASLNVEHNLLALLYPEDGYDKEILTALLDEIVKALEEE